MRIIDECRCTRHHRNARTFARCVWGPVLTRVGGSGQLAVVTSCHDVTVTLFGKLRPARIFKQELGVFGCSKGCTRQHELVALDFDGPTVEAAA